MSDHHLDGNVWELYDTYAPGQDRSLSEAILFAIAEHKQPDISHDDPVLYEYIDPDALDNLFRQDASPEATLEFTFGDVRVHCWGDDKVEIRIANLDDIIYVTR